MLSETRDMEAAKRFFARARDGGRPRAGEGDDGRARRLPARHPRDAGAGGAPSHQPLYEQRMEQDHRGIKQRYYPMRGFGSFDAAARFCSAHDELRDHFRYRQHLNETVSLAEQRRLFQERWGEVCALLQAA